ncbi:Uncharacterised protein [Enterobacter cloacae]|uniref:Uncharacterized protein n=1 Tax=Enterobacter cloacae TaxID=550 RepID=A0A377M8X6_ENTCL|nr:Uncharacterised protein [Enterobacter cloacae]
MFREIFPPGNVIDDGRSRLIQLRFLAAGQTSLARQGFMAVNRKRPVTVLVCFLRFSPATEK